MRAFLYYYIIYYVKNDNEVYLIVSSSTVWATQCIFVYLLCELHVSSRQQSMENFLRFRMGNRSSGVGFHS